MRDEEADVLLGRMAMSLRHRGPDGAGSLWDRDHRIGLAHRRLAIIDLGATGDQPMRSASGRFTIAFNGEIVNAPSLSKELAALGVRLRGHSDTEALLEAIGQWGVAPALDRLAGMFAFALHDRDERRLHLVRDRLGIKPLYWTRTPGGGIAFASESRALRSIPGHALRIDPESVEGYLAQGCVVGDRSIWQGVQQLPPGHRLEFDLVARTTRVVKWWDALAVARRGCAEPFIGSEEEAVERGGELVSLVVRENLLSDVPMGCFLSGGIDSELVAVLARDASSAAAPACFTAGFADAAFDERATANAFAHAAGLAWEGIEISERELLDAVPLLDEAYDEPFADSSQLPTLLLCRHVRQRVKVALSGDGGDEVFAGYNRHIHAVSAWGSARPETRVRRMLARTLRELVPGTVVQITARAAAKAPPLRHLREPEESLRKWIALYGSRSQRESFDALTTGDGDRSAWWNTEAEHVLPDALRRFQFMDQTGYLVDDALVKIDRASMSCGLEVRVPLIDHRLVEFAWSLPPHMKVRGGLGKWLPRKLLAARAGSFKPSVRKTGFSVPLVRWLRGPLRAWARDLASLTSTRDVLPDEAMLCGALDRAESGSASAAHLAWRGLMLVAWHQRWGRGA